MRRHGFSLAGRAAFRMFFSGAALWFAGCAGKIADFPRAEPQKSIPAAVETSIVAVPVPAPAVANPPGRNFPAPTGLDRLLDAHPHVLPTVKAAAPVADSVFSRPGEGGTSAAEEAGKTVFQIQVDALNDMDAAQRRKAVLEAKLGVSLDMIFDPPYYKLRFGSFATRREAEDKLVELAGKNLQGFVVRK